MIYDNLYNEFVSLFSEDGEIFEQLEKEAKVIKGEDSIYVMYDMVVVPYIRRILEEDPEKIKKAFRFFERMEQDVDPEVGNVVEVSVLESLMSDDQGLEKYLPFIGEKTLKAAKRIAQCFDVKSF